MGIFSLLKMLRIECRESSWQLILSLGILKRYISKIIESGLFRIMIFLTIF